MSIREGITYFIAELQTSCSMNPDPLGGQIPQGGNPPQGGQNPQGQQPGQVNQPMGNPVGNPGSSSPYYDPVSGKFVIPDPFNVTNRPIIDPKQGNKTHSNLSPKNLPRH